MSLNVFGRTHRRRATPTGGSTTRTTRSRSRSASRFEGGVIGGVGPVAGDYGALAIDSQDRQGRPRRRLAADDTLASFGRTMLAAVGVDPAVISGQILSGTVVNAALTSPMT